MTMKVILKNYCTLIMTFVTTIETFKHFWSKSSKLKNGKTKGKIILTTLETFKDLKQKEKELYILV